MSTDVADRLASIEARIGLACERTGRGRSEVTLIGAAKRQPEERLQDALAAGLEHFGENQVQEAAQHREWLDRTSSSEARSLSWHLIGPLQSNKVRRAVALFGWIHSVDRWKIAHRLNREAANSNRRLRGFLEINLGAEPSKHGFAAGDLAGLSTQLAELEHLEILGLMAIPPFTSDSAVARTWFRKLRQMRDELFAGEEWSDRPGYLSMGMSSDFEAAIEEGATHIRIGSSLFGPRLEAPPQ